MAVQPLAFTLALALASSAGHAVAQGAESPVPASVPAFQEGLRPAGKGSLRFLGLRIYDAQLWVSPGFQAADYAARPLALELLYHRDFTAKAIAARSIKEMRRLESFSDEQGQRWQRALQAALPDVKEGDRLLGLYQPGAGAVFQMGGQVVGEVKDPDFSRLFFGIWLSPRTSEPALRMGLIGPPAPGSAP